LQTSGFFHSSGSEFFSPLNCKAFHTALFSYFSELRKRLTIKASRGDSLLLEWNFACYVPYVDKVYYFD
jgi:hypothetical protein